MIRNLRMAAFVALATSLFISSGTKSFGQTTAIANGEWSVGTTWSAGVPTDELAATINDAFTVSVNTFGNLTNLLDIGTATGEVGTLTMTDGDLTIFDSDTVTEPNLPSIRVGQAAGSTGTFNLSGGLVTIAGNVGSGFADGELIVGDVGGGTMTQTGGMLSAADEIVIGLADGSTGVVNVSGGDFRADGRSILVGFDGNGTLNLSGTGEVTGNDEVLIGFEPGSVGVANVSGGRLASNGRSIVVGLFGDGTLNVSGTGQVFANFDLLVGTREGSTADFNLSGGTVEAGFMFSNSGFDPAGSTATITQTGGTFNARIAYVLGQGIGTTTMTHSGGAINALTNNGDMVVGDGNGNTSTYNVSGTATVNLLHNFIVGAFSGSNGTVNQTGGTITAGDNLLIGHDGNGVWNMNGGTNNATNVFLGNFDSSNGTLKITSGTLNLTGNLNVGGALASNAAPDRVEPDGTNGAQGQALDANGTLIVSGSGATIDVGGNFLANPDDKSAFRSDPFIAGADNSATLAFEIFSGSGTSLIDVAGVADLDGAVIDLDLMGGFTPSSGATFDLLTASSFGSTGTGTTQNVGTGEAFTLAAEDVGAFSLAIVPGGNGEILRATFLSAGPAGDFDGDGDVDGNDFLLIQRGLGVTTDASDIADWRANFGSPATPAVGSVPEPSAMALLLVAAAGVGFTRRPRPAFKSAS